MHMRGCLLVLVCAIALCSAEVLEDPVRFCDPDLAREREFNPIHHIETRVPEAGATLTASPSIIANNEDVVVSWTGVQNASRDDWIAIFCPASLGSDSDYLDYIYTSSIQESGSVRFPHLINMRCDYGFRYYRADKVDGRYPLVAVSNTVSFEQGNNEVLQVHASLTSDPTEMQITWVTGSNQQDAVVQYGLSEDSLTLSSSSSASAAVTYSADQMCGNPANTTSQQTFRDPGWIHTVIINSLQPDTLYYYRCGNDVEGWSEVFWLRTSSSSSQYTDQQTAELNTKFVVYGDMGISGAPAAVTTANRVENEIYTGSQFVMHIGDISYARGYAYIWEAFFNLIQPVASHVPYMINMGNHEYDHTTGGENDPSGAPGTGFHPSWGNYGDDSSGECSVPMYYRFSAPTNGHGIYWYSFDYGNVHVLMMSSEHNYTQGSEQYQWMENDLKAVDRNRTPFIVFSGHRAMYDSELYPGDWEVSLGMRESFEELLYKYQVDIAFWAHYHAYERSCPAYKGECDDNGTVHIVVGTAGASLDIQKLYIERPWSRAYIADFGYCTVSTTRTNMTVQFIHNGSGSVGDEIVLQARF